MSDIAKCDPDPQTKLVDRVEFHARSADHDLRSVRDEIDRAGGFEAESASISRTIGVLFKLREKLRKPADPAKEETAKKK